MAGGIGNVTGRNPLAVMWLEHLLVISMLQHASGDSEPVKYCAGSDQPAFRPQERARGRGTAVKR